MTKMFEFVIGSFLKGGVEMLMYVESRNSFPLRYNLFCQFYGGRDINWKLIIVNSTYNVI